ncbi:MAG: hypothetical protein DIU61_015305 [Bacteroidota bacterium]
MRARNSPARGDLLVARGKTEGRSLGTETAPLIGAQQGTYVRGTPCIGAQQDDLGSKQNSDEMITGR